MPVTVQCPNPACSVVSNLDVSLSGRKVKCKRCGTPFVANPTHGGESAETGGGGPAAEPFPALPAEFGRYRVLKLLGKGGMGSVYLAEDSRLGRKVALKLPHYDLKESPKQAERFVREAKAAAGLEHPNICTVYDAGIIVGRPFISMAFIPGTPLTALINGSPMPEAQAAEICLGIAAALQEAHEKGIVHRDLKPANVMIGGKGTPVVMDFGLAKRVGEGDAAEAKLTREGAVLGTPGYMAPEQVAGDPEKIGPHTDVYALGVVLFELLTGRMPYSGPLTAVLGQILGAPVPSPRRFRPDTDPRLETICLTAMAKDPAERFPDMAAFSAALDDYLSTADVELAASPTVAPAPTAAAPEAEFGSLAADTEAPARATRNRGSGGLIAAVAVAAVVLVAALVAAKQFTVRTAHGDVVIELSDPNARVEVKVDGERIEIAGADKLLTVTAGEHGLTVAGPDFETVTQQFTVKKGEKQVVKVTLKPKTVAKVPVPPVVVKPEPPAPKSEPPAPKPEPDRVAAEWILANRGQLWIEAPNRPDGVEVRSLDVMPAGAVICRIAFDGRNGIDARGAASLAGLKGLTRFTAGDCQWVTDDVISHLAGNKSLTSISIAGTRVGDVGLAHLGKLTGLTEVNLARLTVTDEGVKSLGGLTALRTLTLNENPKIDGSSFASLVGCKNLEYLSFAVCKVKAPNLQPLKSFPRLRAVSAQTNGLGDEAIIHLAAVPELADLDIGENPLTNNGLKPLAGCAKLTRLIVPYAGVNDTGLEILSACPALEQLNVDARPGSPGPTDAAVKHLPAFKRLKWLSVIGTQVTPAGRAAFKRALPDCDIVPAPPPPAPKAEAPKADDGFKPLFNGKDLTGWETHPKMPGDWSVTKDGLLQGRGPEISHLYTKRADYANFHLKARVRCNSGGNSGIYFRSTFGTGKPTVGQPTGYEAQIYPVGAPTEPKTGTLKMDGREATTVTDQITKPDEWVDIEVIASGNKLTVKVNGKTTADTVDTAKQFDRGRIALQVWKSTPVTWVEFESIQIKELK